MRSIISTLILVSLVVIEQGCTSVNQPSVIPVKLALLQTGSVSNTPSSSSSGELRLPIDRTLERVTKKAFWLKVSPGHSPISPERFAGYHTWMDFETFPSEENDDISIYAICTGPLILKKLATGYGGVVVQQCQIEGQEVTIIYGHLKLKSITTMIHSVIESGQKIGILGKGFSQETYGERKHLHLGIHKGTRINIQGYTSTQAELWQWIDPMKYFNKQ